MVDVKVGWPNLEDDEVFLRAIVFPEEERRLYTTAPWSGGFRRFQSWLRLSEQNLRIDKWSVCQG
jgi:hypothetical protein